MSDDRVIESQTLGVGKQCPRCGVRGATLGSVCPACGKPYRAPDLLDWVPFFDDELLSSRLGVLTAAILLVAVAGGVTALVLTHPLIGIPALAVAFVLLVAAIGWANATAERRGR